MAEVPVVGVFDSGVGGITTLHACVRVLPRVRFLYFGDNGNAPYGSRPKEEIARLVGGALERLERENVSAAVLACNTATACCIEEMRRRFYFPVIGTEPAIKPAANACRNVLVLCTPRTASSERMRSLISRFPETNFTVRPLEGLAAAIEAHYLQGTLLRLSDHLPAGRGYDGVVLGCTHYVFLKEEIGSYYGCKVFDGNEGIARRLKKVLRDEGKKEGTERDRFSNLLEITNRCSDKIGIGIHQKFLIKTNSCSESDGASKGENGVGFLGKWAYLNKAVYFRTYVSKN